MTARRPRRAAAVAVAIAGLASLPLWPLAIWSVARGWRFPDLWPGHVSLNAWRTLVSDTVLDGSALPLSLVLSATVALAAVALGLPAATALSGRPTLGRTLCLGLIALPLVVPGISVSIGLHGIFLRLGLANGAVGVALVHLVYALPYAVFILLGAITRQRRDWSEAARSLGASPWQTLLHVQLPLLAPALWTSGAMAFLVSWGQYATTLTIGGGKVATLPLLLFAYASAGRYDLAGAAAIILLLPVALVLAWLARSVSGRDLSLRAGGTP
jgi:putative spermidine/putrescine transport system permease protein